MTPTTDRWQDAASTGRAAGSRLVLRTVPLTHAAAGARLGAGAGESIEFMEHRAYEPGDDLRRIDWAVYARTDQLIVRRFRAENSPRVDILIDASRSMDLEGSRKARATVAVAAACAEAAARSGLRPRIHRAAQEARELPGAPQSFAALDFDARSGQAPSLTGLGRGRPAVRILITDLMFRAEPRATLTPLLGPGAAAASIICILGRSDRDPSVLKGRRLVDRESGERSTLEVTDRALAEYRERLNRHLASWSTTARALGIAFCELDADDAFSEDPPALDATPLIRCGLMEPRA